MAQSAEQPARPIVVVMGVSGSGKSTLGAALAQRLRVPFADADDFHPKANIDKMSQGIPLTDDDRWPWLRTLNGWLIVHHGDGGVLGCSALRRVYRDLLRANVPGLTFVHPYGEREVLAKRMRARAGHFMPASLLDSQYATLEQLEPDEPGLIVPITLSVDEQVEQVLRFLGGWI